MLSNHIYCSNCDREHVKTNYHCCWLSCECGKKICGMCGSTKIVKIKEEDLQEDDDGCLKKCKRCGLRGCGWCGE